MTIFVKDPAATVDYAVDWSAGYLGDRQISGSDWAVAPAGDGAVTVVSARIGAGQTIATLSGGQAGCVYHITNSVILSDGRRDERTLVLRVEVR